MAVNIESLYAAAFIVGMATPIPQIVAPLAADLASAERGRVVGTVMNGLLIGVLAAGTVAGLIAEWLGWRMVFRGAAGLMVILADLVVWPFPGDPPRSAGLSYILNPRQNASELTDKARITLIWQIMGKIKSDQGTGMVLFSGNDLQSAVDGWFEGTRDVWDVSMAPRVLCLPGGRWRASTHGLAPSETNSEHRCTR